MVLSTEGRISIYFFQKINILVIGQSNRWRDRTKVCCYTSPFLYRYSLPFFFHKASLFLAWVLAMPRAPYPFRAPIRGGWSWIGIQGRLRNPARHCGHVNQFPCQGFFSRSFHRVVANIRSYLWFSVANISQGLILFNYIIIVI